MKIDFSQPLLSLDGEPLTAPAAGGEPKAWTLGTASATALLVNAAPLDGKVSVDEVLKRDALARRIHAGGEHELTASEASQVQELLVRVFEPILSGQACRMLNGD